MQSGFVGRLWVCMFCLLAMAAKGDIVSSAASGFEIRVETSVKATPDVAWRQFLAVGEWWNADHTWFGRSAALTIEPRAGGCFCEVNGHRSALHMIVSYVDPEHAISMVGGLGPLQGLALHGAMHWTFEGLEGGGTRIVLSYRVMGYMEGGLQELARAVDQVLTLQVSGLKAALDAR